ncbi:MAG: 2-hydroxyacyl-CoA dehydratase subunit D [Candidatus Helarchaeota archaeon]
MSVDESSDIKTEKKPNAKMFLILEDYLTRAEQIFEAMQDQATKEEITVINPIFLKILGNYLRKARIAMVEKTKPTVMYNFCIPPEIIYAMDCQPICQEAGSVALSITEREHLKYIDAAEEAGIAPEQCNAQKVWIGAIIKNEIPKPDCLLYGSQPCDSTNILYQVIEKYYELPTYILDVPYWSYEKENKFYDERVIPYFANQVKNIFPWMEKFTGKKFEYDRLVKTIELSNKAREYALELNELMKAKPSPCPSMMTFSEYLVLTTSSGTQDCIDYLKWMRDLAADMVKQGKGATELMYNKEEKIRMVWVYIPIFWDFLLYDWMERRYGAVCVTDLMGYNYTQPVDTSSEESIYEGLARNILDIPMGRQSRGMAEYYLDYLIMTVKEYKADAAIFGGHIACKHSWAIAQLLKEELKKATGVPMLTFEVDSMDPRPVKKSIVKKKLKTFIETLS